MARNVEASSESPVRRRQSPRRSRRDESSGRSSRSPSPRTKRLRRAEGEREVGRSRETRDRDRERRRESERETTIGDKRRRSGRDESEERQRQRTGNDDRRRPERSNSPLDRNRHRSRRSPERSNASRNDEGSNASRGGEEQNEEEDSIAKMRAAEEALIAKKKEEPSFELSGKLAEETNRHRGITLLFSEPAESRKPTDRWRLYVFKDGEQLNEPLYLHRQSVYLFGRERRVADIPTDHPSCSKQHAVIQYREVQKEKADGTMGKQIRPYVMDLGSTNKTYINENPIEPQRYYELFEKDTIKFGNSSREYVLLHENSAE